MKVKINISIFLLSIIFLTACSTTVKRIDASDQVDLSGAWNDTDSQLVAKNMIKDALSANWITNFRKKAGKNPTVIIGTVKNLSHEHINTNTFVENMQREMINSGEVQFVASAGQRSQIREERGDQDINATEATRKKMGDELGADYMLQGQINTIIDVEGRKQVRYYQVNLKLISIKDNRIVWVGEKKIKKYIKNSTLRE
ncbi:MAG: penicillin-binding protein activator LpoB [Psychromonas sp.]|nr:penicillin-binding protein activator LpoB [Psychromonas sp.]